jgi:hypothetical protein
MLDEYGIYRSGMRGTYFFETSLLIFSEAIVENDFT